MKLRFYNHLLVAAVALAMMLSGCKKEEGMAIDVPSDSILVEVGGYERTGTTTFTSENVSAATVTSVPQGWEVVDIDMYKRTITVKSPSYEAVHAQEDAAVESGTLNIKFSTPSGKSKSVDIYVAILTNPDVDYSDTFANCFIACKPNTRYIFDPRKGGCGVDVVASDVEIIWQTSVDLIKYVEVKRDNYGRAVSASFFVEETLDDDDEPTGKLVAGNALLGGYSDSGELLWTWHIWVTNNNPEKNTIQLGGREMMNVNLGADCNSEGEMNSEKIWGSYGMYYQWGRRTPLVGPNDWKFSLNENKVLYDKDNLPTNAVKIYYVESDSEKGTLNWALSNPLAMILGNADNGNDWLYSGHDNELWGGNEKSDNDPCPAGWRLPDSSIFEKLTILGSDDDMDWKDAQGMYGWHLEDTDTGQSYFFTAQGRRNYLDGRLDIVNDDATRPIPWSGYYWTATSADESAKAMWFDLNSESRALWNGFDANKDMQRANAMPVRCVRE